MTLTERLEINERLKAPFKDLTFEESTHTYTIKGFEDKPIKSVSSLITYLYEPFDTLLESEKWAASKNLDPQDVRLAWAGEGDIANSHGTKVHLVGEQYVNHKFLGHEYCPDPIDKQSLGVIQFINDLPDYLIPVCTELQMYNENYWYSGTCDGILFNTRTRKFIIYDFKTNKALTDSYPKGFLKHVNPKHGLKQDKYGKYSAQFSFYQILLEEAGFKVQSRVLVWLNEDKPNKKLYKTYKTLDITDDLRYFLNTKEHLN